MLGLYLSLVDSEEEKKLVEELYKSNKQKMYVIAKSCLHNSQDAEDAVHEAFLHTIEEIEHISTIPADKRSPYLNVIVRNVSYHTFNQNKPMEQIDEETITQEDISTEEEAISNIGYEHLLKLVKNLPDGQKDVMYLKYERGLTMQEIAETLSISEVAVKNRLFKAKKSLKEQIKNEKRRA